MGEHVTAWICNDCWEPWANHMDGRVCASCGCDFRVPASFRTAVKLVARWDARDAQRGC